MVIASLLYLEAARDGVVGVTCIDFGMSGIGWGVLAPLPSGVRHEVDDLCLLEILGCNDFDPVTSLIAYSPSFKVERA